MKDKLTQLQREKKINRLKKKEIQEQINEETQRQHQRYLKKKRTAFWILDILFVFAILNNIGAGMITDYLVVKDNPDAKFYEANPAQCGEKFGWACADDVGEVTEGAGASFYKIFVAQIGIYVLMFGWYIHNRSKAINYNSLVGLVFLVGIIFIALGYDFAHDLALLMGTWTW